MGDSEEYVDPMELARRVTAYRLAMARGQRDDTEFARILARYQQAGSLEDLVATFAEGYFLQAQMRFGDAWLEQMSLASLGLEMKVRGDLIVAEDEEASDG